MTHVQIDREVINVPSFIQAKLLEWGDNNGTLTVYRSPVVSKLDPWYVPVLRLTGLFCVETVEHVLVDDDMMMFGSAYYEHYELHVHCPGEATPHLCVLDRKEPKMRMRETDGRLPIRESGEDVP